MLAAVAALICASLVAGGGPAAPGRILPVLEASGQEPDDAAQPSFRARIELVSLNVTVMDSAGRYVGDLDRDSFYVFEDGAQQEISFFSRTNMPVALSILIDTSASMDDRIKTAQEAAIGFVRRLRPQDLAQVIDFDSRVQILQTFTNDVNALEAAIRRTTAGGSTSLYNAIYISLKELKKIEAQSPDEVRRQAIVVLSDGEDTSSLVGLEEVMDLAKRSETAIYSIGIGLRSRDHDRRRSFSEAEFVLRQFAQQTGGRAFFPRQVAELSGVYGQIADELSNQYTIGYTSRNPRLDGAWRRIVVRVDPSTLTARTKQGYYAPVTN